jgi:CRP/FNR family cyclic AMP-dependent transcriptional regulator
MIEVTAAVLATHPFLHGMSHDQLDMLAGAASDARFPAKHLLFEDGGRAARFWLLRSGYVVLDLDVPGEGRVRVETIGMGELLGWSWLFPPFKYAFGAVTVGPVEAFEFDGRTVRALCEANPELGYEVTRRLAQVIAQRLQATRVRLITRSGRP